MDSFLEQRVLGSWGVPGCALSAGSGPVHQTRPPYSWSSKTGELRHRDPHREKETEGQRDRERATPQTVQKQGFELDHGEDR